MNATETILPSGQRLRYERLSSGIFEVTIGETGALPNAASPLYNLVSDFRLIEQTGAIDAKPGLVFGATYVVSSENFGAFIPMTWITRFPRGGVIADDGMTFERDRMGCDVPNGKTTFQCYSFDHAWEIMPGDWHLELWYGEQMIADHVFTVTAG